MKFSGLEKLVTPGSTGRPTMPPWLGATTLTTLATRFGYACRPVSRPSRGSGCRIAVVTSDRLLMSLVSGVAFSSRNFRVVDSNVFRSSTALATSRSVLVNELVNCARSLFSATNC
ncbi:hypothetical protein BN1047_00001 [Mycolicibacterium neoaurum]|uniref:Uncharacterized protein n=1 Tax=Mycolicibacterium neoaurum TaxID=1795 RepID=A0AAV2WDX9_MYCNE|nr:hypothetical protein BN1047_00001 [Mycolicibacterium neoaurum]